MINQAHNFLLWLVFIGVNSNWLDTSNYKYAPHLLIVAYFKTAKCFSTLTKTVNPLLLTAYHLCRACLMIANVLTLSDLFYLMNNLLSILKLISKLNHLTDKLKNKEMKKVKQIVIMSLLP